MDFKNLVFGLLSSFIIVFRRIILLIIDPYKTMRKISTESDWTQVAIIFAAVFIYFHIADIFRSYAYVPSVLWIFTLIHFFVSITYFYFFTRYTTSLEVNYTSFIFTFAYTLIPTLIWFSVTSGIYAILPPPRTFSLLGQAFSLLYITFSLSILFWKILLFYLAVRFSTKMKFYRIMYSLILFAIAVIPYSMLLYIVKLFRIPFI